MLLPSPRRCLLAGVCLFAIATYACKFDVEAEADADDLDRLVDKAGKIKICGGKTLTELGSVDKLAGTCLDAIQALLPHPETSFEARLLLLGEQQHDTGGRSLFLLGADAAGEPLLSSPLGAQQVSITVNGETRVLVEGEYNLACAADTTQLSLALVNDYSASMADDDLQVLSAIESGLVTALPEGFEAEVHLFSSEVDLEQPFTSERSQLLSAVAVHADYERESTALYDGMGVALESLLARDRPLKVMVVSTDGQENASQTFREAELRSRIEEQGVVVVMMGSLLSKPSALKSLAGSRGVYAYAPNYGDLKKVTGSFVDSLHCIAELKLAAEVQLSAGATLTVAGQSVELP